ARGLKELASKPTLEPLAADRPALAMSVNRQIGVASAVRCMEQVGVSGEADQNVGLIGITPALVGILVCEGLVKRRHATASRLQLGPQGLKGGQIVFLEHSKPFENIWRKGCTRVRSNPF